MQKHKPCSTCPWIKSKYGDCFLPSTLEKTIVSDYQNGRVQYCHATPIQFCAGALSFLKSRDELKSGFLVRMAISLNYIDPSQISTNQDVFGSIEDMLESHQKRCGESDQETNNTEN